MKRSLAVLLSTVCLAAPISAYGVDNSQGTLESDLADEMSVRVIDNFTNASKQPPSFQLFESLYDNFEIMRKWESFLDAAKRAKLDSQGGAFVSLNAAVALLAEKGIDQERLGGVAIATLAGIEDWHATDRAQSELVIEQLSTLLTEISNPDQRVQGALLLAKLELDSGALVAVRMRVASALKDLGRVSDRDTQLDFARELSELVFALTDNKRIEVVSEIVATVDDATRRATLTTELAKRFITAGEPRIPSATAADPLALAWRHHSEPTASLDALIAEVGGGLDPLPIVIALAADATPDQRQIICAGLIDGLTRDGHALRALNVKRALPAADCPADTSLKLAAAFVADDLDRLGRALLLDYLTAAPVAADITLLSSVLIDLGDTALIGDTSLNLATILGADYSAVLGRAAIRSVLKTKDAQLAEAISAQRPAAASYPPTRALLDLMAGDTPASTDFAASDIDLLRAIGQRSARSPLLQSRLAQFLGNTAIAPTPRVALALGLTGEREFDPAHSSIAFAVGALARETGDAALDASMDQLDPATIGTDPDLRLRALRAAAWFGRTDAELRKQFALDTSPDLALEAAAIGAVRDNFELASTSLVASTDTALRASALRFVAERRMATLESAEALHRPPASPQLIKASAAILPGESDSFSIETFSAPAGNKQPSLPDLDVHRRDVTRLVPAPTSGEAGIVIGGEGRYVRLARFESPTFDGASNNGVRDYVYKQNATITPEFIFLDRGVFTLADLMAAIGRDETDAIVALPGSKVRINRPVAIGPDATLILSGAEVDEVQLNGTLGTYIVNAGALFIEDTRLVGYNTDIDAIDLIAKGDDSDTFRPFILSWSGSKTYAAGSEFVALGYSAGRSYGFSLTSGPDDDYYARAKPAAPTGIVTDNSFDNLFYGFYAYEAESVQLVGNEYRDSIIYGIDPHDRSLRLNLSLNSTYWSRKKHGIIISREVNDSFIIGNLTFANHGSGIMLDRSSVGTMIVGNTVRNNEGDGVAVFESPCTLVRGNDIAGNKRSGVLVRNSWDVTVLGNAIANNASAGIVGFTSDLNKADGSQNRNFEVDPYSPFVTLAIHRNMIEGNGTGIQTDGASQTSIYGNAFRHQSGRLFGGDLDGFDAVLLQSGSGTLANVRAKTTQVISVAAHAPSPADACAVGKVSEVGQ